MHLEAEAGSAVVHLDNVPFAAEGFQEAGGHCLALGRGHAGRLRPAVLVVVVVLAAKIKAGHRRHRQNDLHRQRDRKKGDDECNDDGSDPAINIHSQKHTIIPPLGNTAAGTSGRKRPGLIRVRLHINIPPEKKKAFSHIFRPGSLHPGPESGTIKTVYPEYTEGASLWNGLIFA